MSLQAGYIAQSPHRLQISHSPLSEALSVSLSLHMMNWSVDCGEYTVSVARGGCAPTHAERAARAAGTVDGYYFVPHTRVYYSVPPPPSYERISTAQLPATLA